MTYVFIFIIYTAILLRVAYFYWFFYKVILTIKNVLHIYTLYPSILIILLILEF